MVNLWGMSARMCTQFRCALLHIRKALGIFARDSIYAKRAYAIAIPSIRLSTCHTGGSVKNC